MTHPKTGAVTGRSAELQRAPQGSDRKKIGGGHSSNLLPFSCRLTSKPTVYGHPRVDQRTIPESADERIVTPTVARENQVRWFNSITGEVKERPFGGVETPIPEGDNPSDWVWEVSPLEMALSVVPDLVNACRWHPGPHHVRVAHTQVGVMREPTGDADTTWTFEVTDDGSDDDSVLRSVLSVVPELARLCQRAVDGGHTLDIYFTNAATGVASSS